MVMESPEKILSCSKREVHYDSDGRRDMAGNYEKWEGNGKMKHKSSKGEDTDGSGRRKSSGERSESQKLSGGSCRGDMDEGDYDLKKESSSKQLKKKQEVSTLEKLSNWYQDGEPENRHDDKSNRSHSRSDDSERNAFRKTPLKYSDSEGSFRRSKSKDEKTRDGEDEKALGRDSYDAERRVSSREKGYGLPEDVKTRRRWDESDATTKADSSSCIGKHESRSTEVSDIKLEGFHERSTSSRIDPGEEKDRLLECASDMGESNCRHERRIESDRSKSRSRSDAVEEDYKSSPVARVDRVARDKSEKLKEERIVRDAAGNRDRLSNPEEDGIPWMKEKSSREVGHSRRSRTPERNERHRHDTEISEIEYERSSSLKHKESERDGFRDERGKGRESNWRDRSREREGSREIWNRKQGGNDNLVHDRDREPDLPRRGRDRMDNDRPLGRAGNRKDGRSEAVKASSNFGISTENYDVIEIQPKPLDYGLDDPGSSFARKTEAVPLHGSKLTTHDEWACSQDDSSRMVQQGLKGNRLGRGGWARPPGRENQPVNIPVPLMGSPFGHLGIPPPGPMQPMNSGTPSAPGPPVPPGVFVSPFWPGGREVDMDMLPVSPGVSPLPPVPVGQWFPPHMGTTNPVLYFNQPGQGRGMPPNGSGPGLNSNVQVGRGDSNDKSSGGWIPSKSGGPPGKAPSRGEQNDYSQNFVDTGMRPQNFIRELELTNVEDYPKLRELIQKKDDIVAKAATPPMYYKCDLREFVLSPEFFGTKFDVILVDPPWEEYVHRAPGVTDHMEYWTFEEIMNLKIEAIADTPSFIFLWVGDGVGLEQGRQCLKKWGFRRCEDICWVKTNKDTATPGLRHDSHTLFQHSKEHCLMGIKGTVRRSTDGHIIHANIDTDVIIAEEPLYGSIAKPDEMYRIIEHFALGRRRIELFGEDHNIRTGWLTVGKELSSSNFNAEAYVRSFTDKDGKVWQGGGGRNPPPDAPHLVQTTPEIESLRPKSPMKNQQQLQQQPNSIFLATANSSSRRPAGNSPQNPTALGLNQEASSSNYPGPWGSPMEGFKGVFDMYGYNMHPMPPNAGYLDFESQRMMNMF